MLQVRACFYNGRIIEAQTGGSVDDLHIVIENAVKAGYKQEELTAKMISAEEYEELIKYNENSIQKAKNELSALDEAIPRGLEDMWAATGFDTTLLPAKTQEKLARKAELRNLIKQST